jgi:hypothetical protein
MTIAARHSRFRVDVRQHPEKGFSFKQVSSLITRAIFPRGHAVIIPSYEIAFMTAKTALGCRPGDAVPVLAMTVHTIPDMTGLAVLLEKRRVGLSVGLFDEQPLTKPGSHGLVKESIIPLMASDAPPGLILERPWVTEPLRAISMARRAWQGGMYPLGACMVRG